jgi:serine/threonine protein kinase
MIGVCPPEDQLKSFSLGQLSDEQSDVLAVHLQGCDSCQAEMGTLESAEDTFVSTLKATSSDIADLNDDASGEAECKVATARALAALGNVEGQRNESLTNIPRMIGEYEIVEALGKGGMGHVFLGRHTKLGRPVAIKFIADHRRWDSTMHERFASEMRTVGGLNHPNIVAAHDAREVDGLAVLVTEYIDGLNASEIVSRQGPMSVADSCAIIQSICKALEYCDSQGLVHRDIKPSNIMIDESGTVKLLDLGLARLQTDEDSEFTATGQAIGTADYVAPEQINDGRNIDGRMDAAPCDLGFQCAFSNETRPRRVHNERPRFHSSEVVSCD